MPLPLLLHRGTLLFSFLKECLPSRKQPAGNRNSEVASPSSYLLSAGAKNIRSIIKPFIDIRHIMYPVYYSSMQSQHAAHAGEATFLHCCRSKIDHTWTDTHTLVTHTHKHKKPKELFSFQPPHLDTLTHQASTQGTEGIILIPAHSHTHQARTQKIKALMFIHTRSRMVKHMMDQDPE